MSGFGATKIGIPASTNGNRSGKNIDVKPSITKRCSIVGHKYEIDRCGLNLLANEHTLRVEKVSVKSGFCDSVIVFSQDYSNHGVCFPFFQISHFFI